MTEISDLVARLLAAGAAADVAAVVVVEAYDLGLRRSEDSLRTVCGQPLESTADAAAQRRRNADKQRKREARAAAKLSPVVCGLSADSADKRCDLSSSFLSIESGIREERKESKTEIEAPAKRKNVRGTRMSADEVLTSADAAFARELGMDERAAQSAWAEFKDFWIAIPGQRGTKLDWSATWRNRVRQIGTRGRGSSTSKNQPSFHEIAQSLGGDHEGADTRFDQDDARFNFGTGRVPA